MKLLPNGITVLTLFAVTLSAVAAPKPAWILGEPAATPSMERAARTAVANRTIAITECIERVNVNHYEVVRFTSSGREFTWYFNGVAQPGAFDLSEIAPAGFIDHRVTVYVAPASIDLPGG